MLLRESNRRRRGVMKRRDCYSRSVKHSVEHHAMTCFIPLIHYIQSSWHDFLSICSYNERGKSMKPVIPSPAYFFLFLLYDACLKVSSVVLLWEERIWRTACTTPNWILSQSFPRNKRISHFKLKVITQCKSALTLIPDLTWPWCDLQDGERRWFPAQEGREGDSQGVPSWEIQTAKGRWTLPVCIELCPIDFLIPLAPPCPLIHRQLHNRSKRGLNVV